MPKLTGEQLPLLMPVPDRPRSEWVDMHCPLLAGIKPGDRVYDDLHSGLVELMPDAAGVNCIVVTWDYGATQYLTRSLVQRLENKPLRAGDRCRYPMGIATIYYVYPDQFKLGGTKYAWLPTRPGSTTFQLWPLPLLQPTDNRRDRDDGDHQ